jgi:hypothetical protein
MDEVRLERDLNSREAFRPCARVDTIVQRIAAAPDSRQLGYKHAKYVMRLELVADFADIGDGKGGYWEDQGYQWYAGI